MTALYPYRNGYETWVLDPAPLAQPAWSAQTLHANVDAWLAGATRASEWALVNVGVNDIIAGRTQGQYEADLAYVLDAVHTAWPSCKIRVSYVWMQGYDAQCDTMAGWIDNVLATRGPWAAIADDERVWFKPNVATYSTDGIHFYTAAGETAKMNQSKTVMGY